MLNELIRRQKVRVGTIDDDIEWINGFESIRRKKIEANGS